jgi:C1A family cysteine protease
MQTNNKFMLTHHQTFRGGWFPQLPDHRDRKYTLQKETAVQSVYLSSKYNLGHIFDQASLGSCVSQSVGFLVYFDLLNKKDITQVAPFVPSRLFIYYYGRLLEGDPLDQDTGLDIRTGIKVINQQGAPSEDLWAYNIDKFAVKPSQAAINQASQFLSVEYKSIDNTNKQLLVAALQEGFPIAFGFTVYESFMSDKVAANGIVPMPALTEKIVGGHAVVIVGYMAGTDSFICRNSWGDSWGQGGYFRMKSDYICNPDLASDFWIISSIK